MAFRKIIRLDVDGETTNLIDMPPVNLFDVNQDMEEAIAKKEVEIEVR